MCFIFSSYFCCGQFHPPWLSLNLSSHKKLSLINPLQGLMMVSKMQSTAVMRRLSQQLKLLLKPPLKQKMKSYLKRVW